MPNIPVRLMEDFSSFDCANFIRDFCFNYKSQISLWHWSSSKIGHISLVFFFIKTWFQLFLTWIDDQSYFRPELLTGQYQCVLGLVNLSNPSSDWGTFEPWENVLGDSRNTPPLSLFSPLRWVVGKQHWTLPFSLFDLTQGSSCAKFTGRSASRTTFKTPSEKLYPTFNPCNDLNADGNHTGSMGAAGAQASRTFMLTAAAIVNVSGATGVHPLTSVSPSQQSSHSSHICKISTVILTLISASVFH